LIWTKDNLECIRLVDTTRIIITHIIIIIHIIVITRIIIITTITFRTIHTTINTADMADILKESWFQDSFLFKLSPLAILAG
jgi:hypothetical protein